VEFIKKMEKGYKLLFGKPQRREHLEDPGIDGRIIAYRVKCVDQIHLVQENDQFWARVNMIMNLLVTQQAGS
jgi:hypothetical protein